MNAYLTSRGRRLLLLLAIGCSFAGFPPLAHADVLVSHLTNKADALAGPTGAQLVYRSYGQEEAIAESAEHLEHGTLAALAVILVLPPGITPMPPPTVNFTPPPPPPPPPPPSPPPSSSGTPPPDTGSGHISGGGTPAPQSSPEPASLILALTGSGTAALLALARRRRRTAAAEAR